MAVTPPPYPAPGRATALGDPADSPRNVIDEVEIEPAAPTEDVISLDEALTNLTNQTDYPSRCYLLDARAGLTL